MQLLGPALTGRPKVRRRWAPTSSTMKPTGARTSRSGKPNKPRSTPAMATTDQLAEVGGPAGPEFQGQAGGGWRAASGGGGSKDSRALAGALHMIGIVLVIKPHLGCCPHVAEPGALLATRERCTGGSWSIADDPRGRSHPTKGRDGACLLAKSPGRRHFRLWALFLASAAPWRHWIACRGLRGSSAGLVGPFQPAWRPAGGHRPSVTSTLQLHS